MLDQVKEETEEGLGLVPAGNLFGHPLTLHLEGVELKGINTSQITLNVQFRLQCDWPVNPVLETRGATYLIRTVTVHDTPILPALIELVKAHLEKHKSEVFPSGMSIDMSKWNFDDASAMNGRKGYETELWVHQVR